MEREKKTIKRRKEEIRRGQKFEFRPFRVPLSEMAEFMVGKKFVSYATFREELVKIQNNN